MVKPDQTILQSLEHYEKTVTLLKAQMVLNEFQQKKEQKAKAFERIFAFQNSYPEPTEPLTEEEAFSVRLVT